MTQRICVIPKVHGVGGMVSFLHKFSAGVQSRGIQVSTDLSDFPYDAVLVIGGTRNFPQLLKARRKGVRVVQRLDGLNWIQRVRPISLKHTLRAEYGNQVLSIIRRYLSHRIVYQSEFSQRWWNHRFGKINSPNTIIYNGVDLQTYIPASVGAKSCCVLGSQPALGSNPNIHRLLVVEGSLGGGYENGLENAIRLAEDLSARRWKMEVQVVGEVSQSLRTEWTTKSKVPITWSGLVQAEQIPFIDRMAHLLFSADVHPACPNSVIEALACGLPIVSFDTGSLSELVSPDVGFIGSYGSNSWKLEKPDVTNLVSGAESVLREWSKYSEAARKRAEQLFGLDQMVEKYLEVLLG